MITVLNKVTNRVYNVKLLRNARSDPKNMVYSKTVYKDDNVRITQGLNNNDRPVEYIFEFRGSKSNKNVPPYKDGKFWVAVFYREYCAEYTRRRFRVVYNDTYIRLLKFGKENYDYAFFVLCPYQHIRVGDKRFSTIANAHAIEKEVTNIELIIGDDNE